MGFANPVSRALARTPAGRLFRSLVVLEFDGRRTGRHYAVPVMTYEYDGGLVAFTDARWARNFTGGAPVVVRRHGRAHPGSALLAGADESAAGLRAVLAGLKSPGRLGLAVDEGHAPTDAELAAARSMIRLTLDPPSGGR
jgi:hypothetical protein